MCSFATATMVTSLVSTHRAPGKRWRCCVVCAYAYSVLRGIRVVESAASRPMSRTTGQGSTSAVAETVACTVLAAWAAGATVVLLLWCNAARGLSALLHTFPARSMTAGWCWSGENVGACGRDGHTW